jgi:hypothetical protein
MKVSSGFMKNVIGVVSSQGFLEAPAKLYC